MNIETDLVEELQKIADYFANAKLHSFEHTLGRAIMKINQVNHVINDLEAQRDYYREHVVWGFYEDKIPVFYQGSSGEHEISEPITASQANRMTLTIKGIQDAIDYLQSRSE